jgi:hypothetical protein
MSKNNWVTRTTKAVLWLAPGVTLLGTSCGVEMRNSAISAGADFVGTSLGKLLEALVPVDAVISQIGGGSGTSA